METYYCKKISYSYQGTLELKEALKIKNKKQQATLYVVDDFLCEVLVKTQILKNYEKLVRMLQFFLDSDDDTGVAYQEALNELERFRRMYWNKKRYLMKVEQEELEKDLKKYEEMIKRKLFFLSRMPYQRTSENRRSK